MSAGITIEQVEVLIEDDSSCYVVKVPGTTEAEGVAFLEMIGTGTSGSGLRMTQLGRTIPAIRTRYEEQLADLFRRKVSMQEKLADGRIGKIEYARWLFEERRRIAYTARWQQGVGAVTLLEARDWATYGARGRTWDNIHRRAAQFTPPGGDPLDRIIHTASRPNQAVSEAAIRGARMLRRAGPVFVVVGLGMDAHEIYAAPQGQRADVAGRVASEAGGGFLGAGAGVGLCIAFGIVTSGWGLLACGAVGGLGGGLAGGQLYRSVRPQATLQEIERQGYLDDPKAHLMAYQ